MAKHGTRKGKKMLGGADMLTGSSISGGVTSGQRYQTGGTGEVGLSDFGSLPKHQSGGAYQMIVPAALVLANNVIGRGRSLRYKGKGGLARGNSSSYSRRRKGSRRR